jgi:ABC-type multidrug transport system fused ATPase/permease subunit
MVLRGAAGSGRSTLLRLLAGAVEPNTGRVLLDGHRHTDLPREVLRASIGLLPATPRLFPGSVADNVTLFDDDIDDAALDAALDDSGLTDVVAGRGGPRKAVVTQGGRNFAGGERQRLALARALVRRPSVLLLDDPTKGLDPQLRARIDTMLRRRGATTVMATDLPSAARRDDLVLTLHDGRLRPVEVAR